MQKNKHRIRRTMLFTPGDRPDRIKKSATLDSDIVVIDLEDGVDIERKDIARQSIKNDLKNIDFSHKECAIRINPISTKNGIKDFLTIESVASSLDSVIVPKAESAQEIQIIDKLLDEINPEIEIIVVLESPIGILEAQKIVSATPKITAVIFGGGDLSGDIGCSMNWEPLFVARQMTVLAAAAARIDVIDVPFLNLEDMSRLKEETNRVCEMGFTGKAVIHPKQIEVVNQVFTPSESKVEWAQNLLKAVKLSGQGAIRFEGKMVDAAIVKQAEKIMQIYHLISSQNN